MDNGLKEYLAEVQKTGGEVMTPEEFDNSLTGAFNPEIEAKLDLYSLKSLFFDHSWPFIVCNLIARKIARQRLTIYRELLKDGSPVQDLYPAHPLSKSLKRPNDWEGYANFMYKVAAELPLMGNAIIWKLRFHQQYMLLPTELVRLEFGQDRKLAAYCVDGSITEEMDTMGKTSIRIHPDDIIHIKLPNPKSVYWGLSPFFPGRRNLLFDRYSQEYMLKFFVTQTNPGMVLTLDSEANENQALRFMKSVEAKWIGRRSNRKTMILPKGVSATNLNPTFAEQEIREHIRENKDVILGLFAAPKHELGMQESGSLGSEETRYALLNFYESTIIPYQDLISDAFTHSYQGELGERFCFGFDNSNVSVLQEDDAKKAETAEKMLSTLTLNEVRQRIWNVKPIEGGDEKPGRSQAPGPMQFSLAPPKATPSPFMANKNRERAFLAKYGDWWARRKGAEEDVAKTEQDYLQAILGIFADMAPAALREFKKLYKNDKGRVKDTRKGKLEDALNRAFKDFEKDYSENGIPYLHGSSELGYDLQLDIPFNLPNREEIIALRTRNQNKRRAQLKARGLENFADISKTTTDQIINRVAKGVEESKTVQEIAKDIVDYFSKIIPSRAMTIARTEILGATSAGQEAAYQDAMEVIPGMSKMWINAGDSRVRDSHVEVGGEVVKGNKSFSNGLSYPRDPSGDASETINCRCNWIMIPPGEDLDFSGIDL